MLKWLFGNEKDKLRKQYRKVFERAIHQQRNGNIRGYSELIAKSEEIAEKIAAIEASEQAN